MLAIGTLPRRSGDLVCVVLENYIGSIDDNGDIDVSEETAA
jgi:hypothetical protein